MLPKCCGGGKQLLSKAIQTVFTAFLLVHAYGRVDPHVTCCHVIDMVKTVYIASGQHCFPYAVDLGRNSAAKQHKLYSPNFNLRQLGLASCNNLVKAKPELTYGIQ